LYFFGTGANDPAISRKITEAELIDKHHWTPQQIREMPYKDLQTYLLIENQKNASIQTKTNIEKAKSQHTMGSGQSKRFYREV
jgi:hypothetical protein